MVKNIKTLKNLLKKKYDVDIRRNALINSIYYSMLIYFPIIIATIELFYVFIMIPYIMATICLLLAGILALIINRFYYGILKKNLYIIDFNYNKLSYYNLCISLIPILLLYIFGIFYLIPHFVL